ncbi:hypothetical protein O9992_08570 [Vibrio lentus]|nr:hypothetical protein [Vibrio lentus]
MVIKWVISCYSTSRIILLSDYTRVVKESKVQVELFSIGVGEWAIIFNASIDSGKIEQRFAEFG